MLRTTLFFLCCSFTLTTVSQNYSKEEQTIMSVIKQETDGWWERDYQKWASSWVHEDYISWSGTTNVMRNDYLGWNELDTWVKDTFKKYPDPNTNTVERTDWTFRIYKKGAWVRFTQKSSGTSQEIRILEKHGGKWKLVHVGWINDTSFEEDSESDG